MAADDRMTLDPAREAALRELAERGVRHEAAAGHAPPFLFGPRDVLALLAALDASRAEAAGLRLALEAIGAELRARYADSEREPSALRAAVWGLLANVRAALSAADSAADRAGGG